MTITLHIHSRMCTISVSHPFQEANFWVSVASLKHALWICWNAYFSLWQGRAMRVMKIKKGSGFSCFHTSGVRVSIFNNPHNFTSQFRSLLTKAPRSKRREVFLSILSSCYTTLDAKLFEDAATLLPGYFGAYNMAFYSFIYLDIYRQIFALNYL